MAKKGITPIISVVLLLMMTVAAFGLAFMWLKTFQEDVQGEMSKATKEQLYKTKKSFKIVSVYEDTVGGSTGTKIVILNNGESTFSADIMKTAKVMIDGKYMFTPSNQATLTELKPSETATLEINIDLFGGTTPNLADGKPHKIKVMIGKWESSVICGPLDTTDTACIL